MYFLDKDFLGHNKHKLFLPVLHCCYNKFSQTLCLEQYKFIIFWRPEYQNGSHWAKIMTLARGHSFLDAPEKAVSLHYQQPEAAHNQGSWALPPSPEAAVAGESFCQCVTSPASWSIVTSPSLTLTASLSLSTLRIPVITLGPPRNSRTISLP